MQIQIGLLALFFSIKLDTGHPSRDEQRVLDPVGGFKRSVRAGGFYFHEDMIGL